MQTTTAPRHFVASNVLPGAGLPHDRMARLAARQAFVVLKLRFTEALTELPDTRGAWLRHQVRSAEEPIDLWMLRAPVFAALAGNEPLQRHRRQDLRRAMDLLFQQDSGPASGFASF